jgi:diguanylate cyclase (GGDEF)-like protein
VTTVSIGLACFPDDGRTLDALAARADRALYQAKQEGRNRVVRYKAA